MRRRPSPLEQAGRAAEQRTRADGEQVRASVACRRIRPPTASWVSLMQIGMDRSHLGGHDVAVMLINPRNSPNLGRANMPRSVDVLTYPAVQLLDVTGPVQVFASANDIVAGAGGARALPLRVVAQGGGERDGLGRAWRLRRRSAHATRRGAGYFARRRRRGRRGGGREPGAGRLGAAAGDRRRVASPPSAPAHSCSRLRACWTGGARRPTGCTAPELAQRFPAVRVEPDPIFVCDGPVWTSAGVTAGIDLALALVEEDLGRAVALAVARYLVVFLKRPGGQAQFSAALALQAADDKFGALHDWINGHLADDLSLSVLADQAGMSERSFSRHYAEATGQTPARAIERLRVEAARRLLSESRLPVKRIAQRCGFGSEETMRRSFLRLLAVTPQDYRARFSF